MTDKPVIEVSVPFDELVDCAESALATDSSIFQRGGELVCVARDGVNPLRTSIARYALSRAAAWKKTSGEEEERERFVHPPVGVAKCIIDKTSWRAIPRIRAVAPFPPISSDGTIKSEEGYDPATLVFFTGGVEVNVAAHPTKDAAHTAAHKLLNVVCDFPFAGDAHRSAWLSALLSPLVRFAHDGNSPITVVQANSPRVGKSTLIQLISYIVTGADLPVITHTRNEEEERKRILSYLRKGRTLALIDNIVGQFGGANINALITSRTFEDRALGGSKLIQATNDTTWAITGNNITLAADTAERCTHIRLHSDEEKPHLRTGFKHNVFDMVRQERASLLSAALTIIKAYIAAGMPEQNIPPWGSFESWSRLVRGAIVYAGFPDPAATREELETESDVSRHAAIEIIEGWDELLQMVRSEDGLTTREAIAFLNDGTEASRLRAVFEDMTGSSRLPSPHRIARHLREIKDRNFGGKMLKCISNKSDAHRWYVETVSTEQSEG